MYGSTVWAIAAHPRVSGENASIENERTSRYGSSPRERGKQAEMLRHVGKYGLIPA